MMEQLDRASFIAILDAMHEGVMLIDKNLKIVYYNESMGKIEDYEREDVINKDIREVYPLQTEEKSTIVKAIREGKASVDIVQNYVTGRGKNVSTVISSIPIRVDGEIIGAVEINKDITSQRKLMSNLIDMQNTLNASENTGKKHKNPNTIYSFHDIVGESHSIKQTLKYARQAAKTDSMVLIQGETGTGKEIFAQSIHNSGARCEKPFVAVNCAALPGELLEGILFGTVRGGFTGSTDRAGLFEEAEGGTLLLDEIDSMDIILQAKLLRVLQEGTVRRVGGGKDIKLNVRIISAANSNLMKAMEKGTFRRDLFYRLSVVNIDIPPLRERGEDIIYLANFFLDMFNGAFHKSVKGFSREVEDLFSQYYWPGNVRELKHCIEGAMNMIENEDVIRTEHLPSGIRRDSGKRIVDGHPVSPFRMNELSRLETGHVQSHMEKGAALADSLHKITASVEKEKILQALMQSRGCVTDAAQLLGVKRQTLQYKMKKYGITKDRQKVYWTDV